MGTSGPEQGRSAPEDVLDDDEDDEDAAARLDDEEADAPS
jgi:hypothetical protein